jgi:hypothetical protein
MSTYDDDEPVDELLLDGDAEDEDDELSFDDGDLSDDDE